MTTFAEIIEDVYTITNARHLVSQTILAVKSATLQLHERDFFAKDLVETALQFTPADYLQSIQYRSLFPRYRALKYIRKFDPTATTVNEWGQQDKLSPISPDQILDSYGYLQNDVYYIAGDNIQIKSSTLLEYCLIGLYMHPDVSTPDSYKSWIADERKYAVVYQAASIVMGNVLRDQVGKAANQELASLEFAQVLASNILVTGE